MKNLIVLSALIFILENPTLSLANQDPIISTQIGQFDPAAKKAPNLSRIRISVSANLIKDRTQIKVGNIFICSNEKCFKPPAPISFESAGTEHGSAKKLVDALIPNVAITKIIFDGTAGVNGISGLVTLDKPLVMNGDYHGGEIFVVLERYNEKGHDLYKPRSSASSLISASDSPTYYDPQVGTYAELGMGVKVSIPAGALKNPEIFNISIHDTGEKYPMIDIFPYKELLKSAEVTIPSIRSISSDSNEAITAFSSDENSNKKLPSIVHTAPKVIKIEKTDVILNGVKNKNTKISKSTEVIANCSDLFLDPDRQKAIKAAQKSTGVAYVDWCTKIEPYIWIAIVDTTNPMIGIGIEARGPDASTDNPNDLSLRRLTDYLGNSIIVVNGFTWTGDKGTGPGQIGAPLGYVTLQGLHIDNNMTLSGTSQGNKFVMAYSQANKVNFVTTSDPLYDFGDYKWVIISSSTSVVKNNVCTTDALDKRWTAVGASKGILVYFSSVSTKTTTAAKLCPVFKSLGVGNALRLDGGPSTAMTISGALKNPNSGMANFLYGDVRYTAYALGTFAGAPSN